MEAGFRMALTRSQPGEEEWRSVLVTAGCHDTYRARHDMIDGAKVADFALRDRSNPSSVLSTLHAARENAAAEFEQQAGPRVAGAREAGQHARHALLTAR